MRDFNGVKELSEWLLVIDPFCHLSPSHDARHPPGSTQGPHTARISFLMRNDGAICSACTRSTKRPQGNQLTSKKDTCEINFERVRLTWSGRKEGWVGGVQSEGGEEQVAIGTPSFALQFWRKSICGGTKKWELSVEEPVMAWVHNWTEKKREFGSWRIRFTAVKVIFDGERNQKDYHVNQQLESVQKRHFEFPLLFTVTTWVFVVL